MEMVVTYLKVNISSFAVRDMENHEKHHDNRPSGWDSKPGLPEHVVWYQLYRVFRYIYCYYARSLDALLMPHH
jgi:hypothetical protein